MQSDILDRMDRQLQTRRTTNDPVLQSRSRAGVLVVDDSLRIRLMTQIGLQQYGFEVWLASDGWEAIEIYAQMQDFISVVLLDVHMPGLNGMATLDALRQMNGDIRACFMSSDSSGYFLQDLLQLGDTCLVTKPFSLENLVKVLLLLTHGQPGANQDESCLCPVCKIRSRNCG